LNHSDRLVSRKEEQTPDVPSSVLSSCRSREKTLYRALRFLCVIPNRLTGVPIRELSVRRVNCTPLSPHLLALASLGRSYLGTEGDFFCLEGAPPRPPCFHPMNKAEIPPRRGDSRFPSPHMIVGVNETIRSDGASLVFASSCFLCFPIRLPTLNEGSPLFFASCPCPRLFHFLTMLRAV